MSIEKNLSRESDILQIIAQVSAALVGHFELGTLLNRIVQTTMNAVHAEVCSVFIEDSQNEPGVFRMMAGSSYMKDLVGKAAYKFGEGLTGFVAKQGKRLNIHNKQELFELQSSEGPIWVGKFDDIQWRDGRESFRNLLAVPLKIRKHVIGVIRVENKVRGEFFTQQDELYIEIIASIISIAIENARLHKKIEEQLRAISAKAAHRMGNQLANYDGIELWLLDYISSDQSDKNVLKSLVSRLQDTTKSLKSMIGEFKNYGKPLLIDKRACDVNKIILDEIRTAKLPEYISIETSLSKELPAVHLDEARFGETIKELIYNAIKAIYRDIEDKSKGKISISTKYKEPEITQNTKVIVGQVVIDIMDDGPGFPLGFPLFEPFQTTDPSSTGLGLATVKETVESHGGEIKVIDRGVERGAHFRLILPVQKEELQ